MHGLDWRAGLVFGLGLGLVTVGGLYAVGETSLLPVTGGTVLFLASIVMAPMVMLTLSTQHDRTVDSLQARNEAAEQGYETTVDSVELDGTWDRFDVWADRRRLRECALYYTASTFVLALGVLALLTVR